MTGARKPVENHSRRLRAKISASWFSTVSLSPWKARHTPPTFPHSHSRRRFCFSNTNCAPSARKKGAQRSCQRTRGFRLILRLENVKRSILDLAKRHVRLAGLCRTSAPYRNRPHPSSSFFFPLPYGPLTVHEAADRRCKYKSPLKTATARSNPEFYT